MSQRRAEPPRRRRRKAGAGRQAPAPDGPSPTGSTAETTTPDTAASQSPAATPAPGTPAAKQDPSAPRRRPRRRRSRGRGGANRSGTADRANPTRESNSRAGAVTPTGAASGRDNNSNATGEATGKAAGKAPGKRAPRKTPAKSATKGTADANRKSKRTWMRRVDEFSAGGLVLDLDGDVPRGALIGRTDKLGRLLWSLPKGHIEEGETAEQAAVREVEEETGISGVIVGELGTIDFWFVAEGRRIHKTVRHFLMRAVGGELSDADVEVTAVAWVPLPEISDQLAYPDERGLVETAGRMLAESA